MAEPELQRATFGLGTSEDVDLARFEEAIRAVEAAPAIEGLTPREWIKANLFSNWWNSVLTVVAGSFALFVLYQAGKFVFVTAEWRVVQVNIKGYMVGGFPIEEVWRIWVCAYLVAVLAGLSMGSARKRMEWGPRGVVQKSTIAVIVAGIILFTTDTALVRVLALGLALSVASGIAIGRIAGAGLRRPLVIAWLLSPAAVLVIVLGFGGVPLGQWEGFFFNIIAATVGITASFPIGVLLALGRRSELPALRIVSVVFIEIFRGVPLVAWLIFSKYVVDLLLPPQWTVPDIFKAFIAMTMFSAAYVGEIVRGGLQGIPNGQYEAARALGLKTTRMMVLVVLPQALRSTIPAMISHFISLFKDTSLFIAIEVTDLLAAARRSANALEFFGLDMETLLFSGLIFWAVAFSMSRWSQRLETRLGVGER
jgi:general L-amino acid transport system permease protein